jgi:neurofibromin 1
MITYTPCSCGPIITILEDVLLSCQNTNTLESAHHLFRTLTTNPTFLRSADTTEMLEDVLEAIGFGGLWRSSTFHVTNEQLRQCTALTDRLIEVCDLTRASSPR